MTTRYFAKSFLQETCILYNFIVSILSDLVTYPWRDFISYRKSIFACKTSKNFQINCKYKVTVKKEDHRPIKKSAKTNLKAL